MILSCKCLINGIFSSDYSYKTTAVHFFIGLAIIASLGLDWLEPGIHKERRLNAVKWTQMNRSY